MAEGICLRHAWQPRVQTFATDAVPSKASSQPPCGEDTGNKEGIVLSTEKEEGSEKGSRKYLPQTGHTSPSQVLCSYLFSSFLFPTESMKIRPISLTFVPHSSQCRVSLKFWCHGSPASTTVEFSNPCQRWSSLIFLPERKKTLLWELVCLVFC